MSKQKLTAEMYLCDFLNSSREELQFHIKKNPTKVILAMEKFSELKTKDLEHFKDSSLGLNVTDKPIGDLLEMFWQRSSDACPLECSEAEKQESEFKEWAKSVSWILS